MLLMSNRNLVCFASLIKRNRLLRQFEKDSLWIMHHVQFLHKPLHLNRTDKVTYGSLYRNFAVDIIKTSKTFGTNLRKVFAESKKGEGGIN